MWVMQLSFIISMIGKKLNDTIEYIIVRDSKGVINYLGANFWVYCLDYADSYKTLEAARVGYGRIKERFDGVSIYEIKSKFKKVF